MHQKFIINSDMIKQIINSAFFDETNSPILTKVGELFRGVRQRDSRSYTENSLEYLEN